MNKQRFHSAMRAAAWHLFASVLVACCAAGLVFGVLYPAPYAQMLGGFELFALVVGVDVVCGPLLTFVLFNPVKSRLELSLDLGIVGCLQLAALVYGLQTVWVARPMYLAYEVDRFRVVTQADLEPEEIEKGVSAMGTRVGGSPIVIGVQVAQVDDPDYLSQLQLSLNGQEAAFRTDRWRPYTNFKAQVLERSHGMAALYAKHPEAAFKIAAAISMTNKSADELKWLPIQSRKSTAWTALVSSATAQVVGYVELDGF